MKRLFIAVAAALLAIGSSSAQKKEVLALQQEVAALKGTIETLQTNAKNDRATIQQLTTTNNTTLGKVEALAAKLDATTKLNSEAATKIQSLSAQLEAAIKQNGNAATEIANLKAQVEALTKLLNEKMTEIEGKLSTAAAKPEESEKPKYEVVGKMNSGMVLVKEGLLYGYVNSKNEYIIPAKYEEAKDFKDGYAVVKKNDKWGIVDASGKETVACSYEQIRHYHGTIWRVTKGNLYGLVSAVNGALIQSVKYTSIDIMLRSNRSNMCINGKYGFLNEKGQVVIPAQFDSSAYFTETGISNVKLNGHRYTINTSGSIIKDGYTL